MEFSYRSSRSASLFFGITMALVAETLGLHLWLVARHPLLAWTLTAISLGTLVWLAADYRALGAGRIRVTSDVIDLAIGKRVRGEVPRAAIASAIRPGWRDLPEPGTPAAKGFVNLTKPGTPNVLLSLSAPVSLRVAGGLTRSASRVALCVDQPDEFLAEVAPR